MFRPLTEYFTVVDWDQRGAGKSAGDKSLYPTMSYERMVDDTIELIEHLKVRLGVEKVIILGHSWGTMLGLGVIKKRPDLIYAYVGSGQGMAWQASFNASLKLMIEAYKDAGEEEIVATLEAVPEQWPPAEDWQANRDRIRGTQIYLGKLKKGLLHAVHDGQALGSDFFLDTLFSPDTSLYDTLSLFREDDIDSATSALRQKLWGWSLLENPEDYIYEVPIFIFQGEHDWQTPTPLVKEWFPKVIAPHKEYISFKHSAHAIITEEPAKYIYTLVNRVRPFALKGTE
jgi:pimeloyl-ACP methyl ester carboxylesterase